MLCLYKLEMCVCGGKRACFDQVLNVLVQTFSKKNTLTKKQQRNFVVSLQNFQKRVLISCVHIFVSTVWNKIRKIICHAVIFFNFASTCDFCDCSSFWCCLLSIFLCSSSSSCFFSWARFSFCQFFFFFVIAKIKKKRFWI